MYVPENVEFRLDPLGHLLQQVLAALKILFLIFFPGKVREMQ